MSSVDKLHVKSLRFLVAGGVNTLVFYEALLKRYGTSLDRLTIPETA